MARAAKTPAPAQTGWFAKGTTPTRTGVYGTSANNGKHPCFQHWNGAAWGKFSGSVKGAEAAASGVSRHQEVAWYGLAEDPAQA